MLCCDVLCGAGLRRALWRISWQEWTLLRGSFVDRPWVVVVGGGWCEEEEEEGAAAPDVREKRVG